jgi:hypothetical protein
MKQKLNATAARQEAIEASQPTYMGETCRHGHSGERDTLNKRCVTCATEGRPSGHQEKKPVTTLGKAHDAWIELRRNNPLVPAHRLWPRFLNGLDPETREAAIEAIEPPQALSLDPKKARKMHDGLTKWADDHGVFTLETRMREALHAGKTAEASRLRADAMALMRRGAAQVNRMVNRATVCSSST